MSNNTKHRRAFEFNRYLINKGFQIPLAGFASLFSLLLGFGFIIFFYYLMHENYAILVELSDMTDEAKQVLYREQRLTLLWMTLLTGLFAAIVFCFFIFLTHKVVGPLERLRREFGKVKDLQDLNPLYIRKRDYFSTVFEAYNQFIERLKK